MDLLVPLSQSDLLAEKLKETGKTYQYYCLKGAGHGSAEFWTEEMYDIVDGFLKSHMKH